MSRSISIVFVAVFSFFVSPDTANGQKFFKKLTDKAVDKFTDQATDELSSMMVEAAMRPLRRSRYRMMKEHYKNQHGEEFDESKYKTPEEAEAALYKSMANYYMDVELPEMYQFDHRSEIETKQDKSKYKFDMLTRKDGSIFGMESKEKGQSSLMIIDYQNDIMVTYDHDKKEAFALKGMFKMGEAMASSYVANTTSSEAHNFSFEPMNKTKKVADCESEGYRLKTEDGSGEVYYCDNLPFEWKSMFGGMIGRVSPESYKGYSGYYDKGMPVLAEFKTKDGEKSSWELKKVKETDTTIKNSDYTLANHQFRD